MTTMTTSESCLSNLRVEIDNATITTKLRSNYGTFSSEWSEISELLKLAEKDLEDYDLELHRLQMQILTLKFQQSQLRNYAAKLSSLRAPIRKLPNELLLRIFLYCCDDAGDVNSWYTPAVIVLSTVCTRWRQLVKSEPQMWARFAVTLCEDEDEDSSEDPAISQVKGYLKRSQDRLLSLHVNICYCGTEVPCGHPGFELLIAQSHRWRSVSIECDGVSESHSDLKAIAFPALETVKIDMNDCDMPARLELFERAPRLRALSLVGCVNVMTQRFPWTQITTLELGAGYLKMYDIVIACPNLQVLKICGNIIHDDYEALDIPFTSNHVVSFSIIDTDVSNMFETVLLSFTFPSLRSLNLIGTRGGICPNHELQNLLSRSRCTLTLLSLCGLSISDNEAFALLQQLPSLQNLSIHNATTSIEAIGTSLIKSLHAICPSIHASSQPLVPHLKTLSLVIQKGDKFNANAFVEMISSRWLPNPKYAASVGISCLRSVELVIHGRTKTMERFSSLNSLERAGMRVFVAKYEEVKRLKQLRTNGCVLSHDSFDISG